MEEFIHEEFIDQEFKFSEVYRYIDKYKNYQIREPLPLGQNETVILNRTIWIYWKQGLDSAPKIVRKCYKSICSNKPDDFSIVLLTDENLNSYVQLPDYIWAKYNQGYITVTHLSDIIRLELLSMYGGCWIDATVFCSSTIPRYMMSGDMFFFKLASVMCNPVLKLSSWWIYAEQSNRMIHLTRQMLYEYWKKENEIRSYFLLHIMMSKIIDEDPLSRGIFYNIPYFNSGNAHVLQGKLGVEYDRNEWEIIQNISPVHKLTYKKRYLQGDVYNYYMAMLADKL